MSRLLAVGFALALAGAPAAAPVPEHLFPKGDLYFPTQVGTAWVYEDNGNKYAYTITAVEAKGDATLVTVGTYSTDRKRIYSGYTVEVSRRGVRETINFNRKVEPPQPLLQLPGNKGDKWSAPFSLNGEPRATYDYVAGGVEDVTVPAGRFRAARVDYTSYDLDGKVLQRFTSWYAPSVGLVRSDYGNAKPREMTSFTLPAKK